MSFSAFIGRQSVLNRNQQIIGYELLFRLSGQAHTTDFDSDIQAGTHVLVNTLSNMDSHTLIGNKLAFINIGSQMLMSDFLELLHPQRVILELAGTIEANEAALARARQLRAHGFGIALDDFHYGSGQEAFLATANYVKLNLARLGTDELQRTSQKLMQLPVIQIAEHVQTREEFAFCHELGMDGFQGHYFAKPETLSARTVHPSLHNILNLLNMLRQNADVPDIEFALKQDVAMSYKLFRYINSAGVALVNEISSFRQAVTLMGYQKLYRWLTLLLVTASEDSGAPPALLKTAVTRARFLELLGKARGLHGDKADDCFIVGMFSLLDVLLDMPMPLVLDNLLLPQPVCDALLERKGLFGSLLTLVETCEDPNMKSIQPLCQELGISADMLNSAHVAALDWVENLRL